MDPAPPERAPAPDSSRLDLDQLARIFGIADLPDRLAAVDRRIAAALAEHDALLGPASLRMAGAGGKRLRPLFTILGAAVGGVFDERVIAAAAAVELVQVGSLVHDDILDAAATRRGRPTINAVEGVDHALLAGDYVLARAAQLAASVSGEAAGLLATALGELCEGQVLELRDAFDPGRSVDAHLASIRGKTAALFECACRLGAHCADLPPHNTVALARFGAAFGMCFQVLDDLLDLIGDPDRLGKPTGIDLASGVYTLPVITALQGPDGDELRGLLPDPAAGPITAGPTTAALTTAGPTDGGPTTAGPTTAGPTTAGPADAGPTVAGSTTGGQTIGGPTGAEPSGAAESPAPDDAAAGSPAPGGGAADAATTDVAAALDLVRRSGSVAAALAAMDRYAADARRAVGHLDQTAVGNGLAGFPRTYTTWALETFMDRRFLEVPLTAVG